MKYNFSYVLLTAAAKGKILFSSVMPLEFRFLGSECTYPLLNWLIYNLAVISTHILCIEIEGIVMNMKK